jgi:hypothetical protein
LLNPPHEFVESGQKLICAGQSAAHPIRLHAGAHGTFLASALISRDMICKRSTDYRNDMFEHHSLGVLHGA